MPAAIEHGYGTENWVNPGGWRAVAFFLFASAFIALAGTLVYLTGGTAYGWPNLMYIPIILAAAAYHTSGGILAALVGGLVLGPLMPLYVAGQIPQETSNWLLRTLFFVLVGGITGELFTRLNRQYERLKKAHELLEASHLELQTTQLELIQAEKLESVGRLAAGVAHEVKNPLAILQLGIDFLANVCGDNAAVVETVQEMDAAVKRADSVIRGLVDFSRFEKLALKTQAVNPIIEKSLSLVRHELLQGHIDLETRLADDIPPSELDRGKIEQTLVNLFINAIHAMEGGGKLNVASSARNLCEADLAGLLPPQRFAVGDLSIIIEINDSGPGIPEDKLDKLFDPFFTTKPVGKGTGLGLSVCRKIIDLHAASIGIRNLRQGGAGVTILLKPTEGGITA